MTGQVAASRTNRDTPGTDHPGGGPEPPTSHTAGLTERQVIAAEALALGSDYQAAADAAGCSVRTLQRWRNRPDFAAEVRRAGRARRHEAVSAVLALTGAASAALAEILRDRRTPAAVRVQAARAVLAAARDADADDLSLRITRLEEARWRDDY